MKIVLLGYRAAGKSTVGQQVAERLGWRLRDVDREIERVIGQSIRDYYQVHGEGPYRRLESDVVERLCGEDECVIAFGAGSVMRPANREHARRDAVVCYLEAPAEVLWERIQADPSSAQTRPQLSTGGFDEVVEMLGQRDAAYRECAHVALDATLPPATLAERVVDEYRRRSSSAGSQATVEPFLGAPRMDLCALFPDQRFPNVVVALDGTVVATWGAQQLVVRRSDDGGRTWGPTIDVGPGIHGGGTTVDGTTGDLLLFGHPEHPPTDGSPAARTVYRSTDRGRSWKPSGATFTEDARGHLPSLHMTEHGIHLRHGARAGRLLRPARVYGQHGGGYNCAIFSDDGGATWQASGPFPVAGTGEGCVAELADGRIFYSSRQHRFADGEPLRHERLHAWSLDGGATWQDAGHDTALPDGPRYRGAEKRGANYNGHFGMAGGLTRLPVAGRDVLLYSNADHDGHERVRLTVWASLDGGASWPVRRLVDAGPSAYSSLEAGRPGTASEGWIYLQYEVRGGGGRLARFNLSWLLDGQVTGALPDWVGRA